MLAALKSRQEALEETLRQRLEELKKLCLREAVGNGHFITHTLCCLHCYSMPLVWRWCGVRRRDSFHSHRLQSPLYKGLRKVQLFQLQIAMSQDISSSEKESPCQLGTQLAWGRKVLSVHVCCLKLCLWCIQPGFLLTLVGTYSYLNGIGRLSCVLLITSQMLLTSLAQKSPRLIHFLHRAGLTLRTFLLSAYSYVQHTRSSHLLHVDSLHQLSSGTAAEKWQCGGRPCEEEPLWSAQDMQDSPETHVITFPLTCLFILGVHRRPV